VAAAVSDRLRTRAERVEQTSQSKGSKMTIANLPSIMGAILIALGMVLVLVQFMFRPASNAQGQSAEAQWRATTAYVTVIIVGALLLGAAAFAQR
jgi:hypothetical protein